MIQYSINDKIWEEFAEEGTDEQFGKYDTEVMNGDGVYLSDGTFYKYKDPEE